MRPWLQVSGGGGVAWTSGPCVTRDLLEIKGCWRGVAGQTPHHLSGNTVVLRGDGCWLRNCINVDGFSFLLRREDCLVLTCPRLDLKRRDCQGKRHDVQGGGGGGTSSRSMLSRRHLYPLRDPAETCTPGLRGARQMALAPPAAARAHPWMLDTGWGSCIEVRIIDTRVTDMAKDSKGT